MKNKVTSLKSGNQQKQMRKGKVNQDDEVIDSISSNNGLVDNISDNDAYETSFNRRNLKEQTPITKKAAPVKSYKINRFGGNPSPTLT